MFTIISVHLLYCRFVMGRCLFASCNSDTKNNKIVFFKTPKRTDINSAKLWFSRARREDMSFDDMTYNHMVCHKHFERTQVERKCYGKRFRLSVKKGELPLVNGKRPVHPVDPTYLLSEVSICNVMIHAIAGLIRLLSSSL